MVYQVVLIMEVEVEEQVKDILNHQIKDIDRLVLAAKV